MKAIWSGAIGFGLVNIPIKLYSAVSDSTLELHMLDKRGLSPVRYTRINASTGKELPWEDVVKAYKYNDQYVVLTDEDFEKVSPRKNKMIDISEFVSADALDSTFYDTPYYAEPEKGGERAYSLLREALKKSGKIAIGEFILRTREHLCVLKPQDDILVLQKIRFPEEIRSHKELAIPADIVFKPAEIKMAEALTDQLTHKKFQMSEYKDTYDADLMKIITAKASGKKVKTPLFKIAQSNNEDLMAQLKNSLKQKAS